MIAIHIFLKSLASSLVLTRFKAMNLIIKRISMCELPCVTNHRHDASLHQLISINFYLTCSKSWKADREHKWTRDWKNTALTVSPLFLPQWRSNYREFSSPSSESCLWGCPFPGNIVQIKAQACTPGDISCLSSFSFVFGSSESNVNFLPSC